ncbi:MAG: guanylate kinase [Acidobacteriota bacterium]|nr:MAG: guanylate kinase [Acidobacteriota bacterium]
MPGNLIIISAPSGAGKTTLVREALKRDRSVRPSVSYTSRARRETERHGFDYFFVSRDEFEAMVERGEFLEWAYVHSNLYGTTRRQVEGTLKFGYDVMLAIDVQGADQIRKIYPEAVSVFILPPSYEALVDRLGYRGDNDDEDLKLRLSNAFDEMAEYKKFDYLIVNDDLANATDELMSIIVAERCRTRMRAWAAKKIIRTFLNKPGTDGGENP